METERSYRHQLYIFLAKRMSNTIRFIIERQDREWARQSKKHGYTKKEAQQGMVYPAIADRIYKGK